MSAPTRGAWGTLKRIGRYLRGAPRLVQKFEFQELPEVLVATGDSDWAGCRRTRKSTSGGLIKLGGHVLKAWSSTQGVISLSSGEAEYYAMLKCGSIGFGLLSLA